MSNFIPYCGTPPDPSSLHWNHAPVLTGMLTAGLALHFLLPIPARRRLAFIAGWLLLALCFLSPLCNLSVALFSARATQHAIIILLATPLIAFSMPCGAPVRSERLLVANVVFMLTLWLWHMPLFLDATLRGNVVYWAMNISIVSAAIWLWRETFGADGLHAFVGVTFTGLQMTMLGAVLTFAAAPLYSVYVVTTIPWGISQLRDQRLGGLIMWVPAGSLMVAYSAIALWLWLERFDLRRGSRAIVQVHSAGAQSEQPT